MPADQPPPPPFNAPYAADDRAIAARLLAAARLDAARERRIDHAATARVGTLQTRVYLEETALVLAAIVASDASANARN